MLTLKNTAHTTTNELVAGALESFSYFGFAPLDTALKHTALRGAKTPAKPIQTYTTDEKKSVSVATKLHLANEKVETPLLCAYHVDTPSATSTKKSVDLYLHTTSPEAIGETLIIASIITTLRRSGVPRYKLYVNSIGDEDSYARFLQGVRAYLRNNLSALPNTIRGYVLSGDLVKAYFALMKTEYGTDAPSPIEFLNDDSRQRFRRVLQHMDDMGIEYELDTRMIGSPECRAHTVFEFRVNDDDNETETVVARGGRYHQKDTRYTLTSARISFERKGRHSQPKQRTTTTAPFFFTYLGDVARVKGLTVLGDLFDASIPVQQALTETHIAEQMQRAERAGAQYIIIMGHKEALEDTVMIRRVADRAQTVVPIPRLVGYLRRLKV